MILFPGQQAWHTALVDITLSIVSHLRDFPKRNSPTSENQVWSVFLLNPEAMLGFWGATQFPCVVQLLSHGPTLCNPTDCSPPGSSVHGILQSRILEWVAISVFRGSSDPGVKPRSPAWQADPLPLNHLGSLSMCIWAESTEPD